jgi:hypothetical protein
LATGSSNGVVNVYSHADYSTPVKSVMNLTTAIDTVQFHPSGDILAFSSRWKLNGARLFHTTARAVFANWPKAGLSYPTALTFSNDGATLLVGNDEGNTLPYTLNYYV